MSQLIDQHLDWLKWNWQSDEMPVSATTKQQWWEFWKVDKDKKKDLMVVGRYLLEGLDDFIKLAKLNGNPLDYKSTILFAIGSLYDVVIKSAKLPWWMRPFGGSLKVIVINILASLLIDFMVQQYESGQWTISSSSQ